MKAREPIPVTIVTGFLGSGKTTLLNRWLAEIPRGEAAVIVNEHGIVGVDGELLAARVAELVEITGGCVCCATQSELISALDFFATAVAPPKRILVETSGAASPAAIVGALSRGARTSAFSLDGVVTVVDATRFERLVEHDLAIEQVGYADVVVLSRADDGDDEDVDEAEGTVRSWNGSAVVARASRGRVRSPAVRSLEELLGRRSDFESAPPPARPSTAPSPHAYESVSLTLDGDVDGERFAEFIESELGEFSGRIFRTKGIIGIAGVAERMIVQGVADTMEVTFGAAWEDAARRSRLVVVGFGLDRAALERGFAACAAGRATR